MYDSNDPNWKQKAQVVSVDLETRVVDNKTEIIAVIIHKNTEDVVIQYNEIGGKRVPHTSESINGVLEKS